jgi:hypothetical protein
MLTYKKVGNILKLVNDENVVSLTDFKEAKLHLEHLKTIKKILELSIKSLSHYQAYTPAFETHWYLAGQLIIVETFIKKFEKVVKKDKK